MKFLKHSLVLALGLLLILISSGCGGSDQQAGTAQNTPTATTQNTPESTPTTATSDALIKTASVTVEGKAVTVLTDAKGLTLYYFTPDKEAKSACSGSCAQTWPPLVYNGSGEPTTATKLPGKLEVYPNDHGKQVAYNNHLLYTYVGDKAAGETKGQGIGGKWFVATTDLKEESGTTNNSGY
jgi:predicted lipoprotein with Yx(FWY)xxD motif